MCMASSTSCARFNASLLSLLQLRGDKEEREDVEWLGLDMVMGSHKQCQMKLIYVNFSGRRGSVPTQKTRVGWTQWKGSHREHFDA